MTDNRCLWQPPSEYPQLGNIESVQHQVHDLCRQEAFPLLGVLALEVRLPEVDELLAYQSVKQTSRFDNS